MVEQNEQNEQEKNRVFECKICSYKSNRKSNYLRHIETVSHKKRWLAAFGCKNEQIEQIEQDKIVPQNKGSVLIVDGLYCCNKCDYKTDKFSNYQRHMNTDKHTNSSMVPELNTNYKEQQNFKCICGKVYQYKSSLLRHQKRCIEFYKYTQKTNNVNHDSVVDNTKTVALQNMNNSSSNETMEKLFMEVVEQNKQLQEVLTIQNKRNDALVEKLIKIANEPKNNTYITNNTQNINVLNYLNTEYKDAMTIDDFLESIQVTTADLTEIRDKGFLDSIGAKIVKELKDMPENKRPVHFVKRRLKEYFTKQMEGWMKEGKDRENLRSMIENATQKHLKFLMEWKKHNLIEDDFSELEYKDYQRTLFNTYHGLMKDNDGEVIKNKIFKQLENLTIEGSDNTNTTP